MAVTDFLFNGSPPKSTTTYGTSTSASAIPQWLSDYTQGMANKANAVGAEPYQAYGGPRVAGFTGDQQNAFSMTRNSVGDWKPQFDAGGNAISGAMGLNPLSAASGYMGQASGTWNNAGTVASYMNPYTQQVNDALAAQAGRNLNSYLLPQVNDTFTRAGQFGSAGQARAVGNTLENLQSQLLEQQSQNLQSGYNSAASNFQSDQSRLAGLGQVAGNLTSAQQQNLGNLGYNSGVLAQIGQASSLKDAAAMEGIGAEQQALTQKNLDTAYGDFLDQRNYPKDQLGFMSNIIRGVPYGTQTSGTTTTTAPYQGTMSASPLAQIASAGLGALSLSKLLGGMADGGMVQAFAEGGPVSSSSNSASSVNFSSSNGAANPMGMGKTPSWRGAANNGQAWGNGQGGDWSSMLQQISARFPQDQSAFQPPPAMRPPVPPVANGPQPPQRDTAVPQWSPGPIGQSVHSYLGQLKPALQDFQGQIKQFAANPTQAGGMPQLNLPQFQMPAMPQWPSNSNSNSGWLGRS